MMGHIIYLLCDGAYLSSFIAKMEKIYQIVGILLGWLIGCQLLLGGLIGCQLQDGICEYVANNPRKMGI